jgi:hypothetical protein
MTLAPSGRAAVAALALSLGLLQAAVAGSWRAPHVLEGPFGTSSPPDAPLVVENAAGHAIAAWSAGAGARYADKPAGKGWASSKQVPGGAKSAGFVAVAIADSDVSAVAYLTVATEFVPSRLKVATRSGTGAFGAPVTVAATRLASDLRLAVAADGALTVLWTEGGAVHAAHQPAGGSWALAVLSSGGTSAWLPDLAIDESGQVLAVWQEGAGYQPAAIYAARLSGDAWGAAQRLSAANGHATWNPKPGLAATGDAAVGWLDGNTMVVARGSPDGSWQAPEAVSGSQSAYYPALSMDAAGDAVVAWQALDAFNTGSIWARMAPAGAGWQAPTRLSGAAEDTAWPTASYARTGNLAVVSWTDDATNMARASLGQAGAWKRSTLGDGWWMGVVPVATSATGAVAGWARPHAFNPNAVDLLASEWR